MKKLLKSKSFYLTLASGVLTIVFLALYPFVVKDQQVDLQVAVLLLGGLSVLFGIAEIVLGTRKIKTFGIGTLCKTACLAVSFGIFIMFSLEYLGLLNVYHYSVTSFAVATVCVGFALIANVVDCFVGDASN